MLPGGRHLIAGGLRTVEAGAGAVEARNSLMVFGAGGALTAIYDKIHLVPFGEYLPMRPVLERIGLEELARQRGGFGIGTTPRPLLSVPGLPLVGPLICYEAIFPTALVQTAARPGVLVNLTNDGWFGNSTGPRQHFHQTRVRAVEEGLPLVRSANNGISAVIAPSGRIIAMLALNDRGTLDADLPQSIAPTTYSRIGDWPFAIFWFLTAALGVLLRNRIKSPA
jgi:apolipoprotein N-acyltransferase